MDVQNNKAKIILDLCGGTGAWSKPYNNAGYQVIIITLPEMDILKYEPPANVYGILAAPPCTEFSRAKGGSYRNYAEALNIIQRCLRIIWQARIRARLKFWALENPCGQLRQFLGNPPYSFQPWWFGDLYTKHTDIWGYFKEPARTIFDRPDELPKVKHNQKGTFMNSTRNATQRSITPAGFAAAFFKANQ
jgi:hypothetical protein